MRITVVAVGKVRERGIREAIDDYLGRLGRYVRVEELELKDAPAAELAPRFERAIPARTAVVALEVDGRCMSSAGLARFIEEAELEGTFGLTFLLGGSYGLPPPVRALAQTELSLSPMTLPHRLARLLLAEQLYRAYTIMRGEPYSH